MMFKNSKTNMVIYKPHATDLSEPDPEPLLSESCLSSSESTLRESLFSEDLVGEVLGESLSDDLVGEVLGELLQEEEDDLSDLLPSLSEPLPS